MSSEHNLTYVEPLTDREMEVLQCLADNFSNREIANQLVVEVSTVKWYNAQIYGKLQVRNRNQAVIRAQTLGILQVDAASPSYRSRHNLPADPIPFIGREDEIDLLSQQLLDEKCRIIAILGPGGMGKSRLAIEVGKRLLIHFRDGVYFLPLASVTSSDEILTAIAEAIGYQFFSELHPRQQLLAHLQRQHLLLIVDNFEHLLNHAELLTDILKTAPRVKMLVTTREKLSVGGEVVHVLHGLTTPFADNQDATTFDAVQLFLEAASRTATQIDSDDLETVVAVCQMLGGMPLAILLATAWLDTLTLGEIKVELEGGLDILGANWRDIPVRHQSLHAVFDYSFRRLTAHERDIFVRLAVFRGGFTREAAKAVAGADMHDLQRLVHTSFIQHLPDGRFAIHELMCQYGEAKLRVLGEIEIVRMKHAQFFADFVQPLSSMAFGTATREMLQQINADFSNIRHAWKFLAERRDYATLRQYLDGIMLFCYEWDRDQEAVDLFEPVVAILQDQNPDQFLFRGQLLARLGWFYNNLGRQIEAQSLAKESLQIVQKFEAENDILMIYYLLIFVKRFMNQPQRSLEYAEMGYALTRKTTSSKWQPVFRTQLAACHGDLGNYAESQLWLETLPDSSSKTLFRGSNLLGMGEYAQAEDLLFKCLNEYRHSRVFSVRLYELLTQCAIGCINLDKAWYYAQHGLRFVDDSAYSRSALYMLAAVMVLLIAEAQYQTAVELMSLIINHPRSAELYRASVLEYRELLENNLTADEFSAAWEHGKQLELGDIITEYMER